MSVVYKSKKWFSPFGCSSNLKEGTSVVRKEEAMFNRQFIMETVKTYVPESVRMTLTLQTFAFLKIPVLAFTTPVVIELNEKRCEVKIPLVRRNMNHLRSMYFAVLAAGADCACGLAAWKMISDGGQKIDLIFKDFQAEFLKRADGDVHFVCDEVPAIQRLVEKAAASGERENLAVQVRALVPSKYGDEPVAKFRLTLSLKSRERKS